MDTTQEHKLPFELIVGSATGEIMNGDVPVRWCVTPALVKELEDHEVVDPHVILVSATPGGKEMSRNLIPMTELMTYVRFNRAGEMMLYGFIVNGAVGRKKLHKTFLQKAHGSYITDLISEYDGSPYKDIDYVYTQTAVTVNIPAGVFGKEPKPLLKWFVNLWHSSSKKVTDECHYRQRFLLAFTLKWPFVLAYWSINAGVRLTIISFLGLCGYVKNGHFLRIFRPFKWTSMMMHMMPDIEYPLRDNVFIIRRKHEVGEVEKTIYMLSTVAFIPIVLIVQVGLVLFLAEYFVQSMLITTGVIFAAGVTMDLFVFLFYTAMESASLGKFAKSAESGIENMIEYFKDGRMREWYAYLAGTVFIIVAGGLLYLTPMDLVLYMLISMTPLLIVMILGILWGDRFMDWLEDLVTVTAAGNDYTEIRELLCPADAENLKPDIHYIPAKQRTIRLWYLEIKNKFCKPMQR